MLRREGRVKGLDEAVNLEQQRSVWASHVHAPGEVSGNVPPRARRGCGAQKFVENLSKICLPDSRFAYKKFAYV